MCIAILKAALLNSRRYLRPLTRVGGRYAGQTPLGMATYQGKDEVAALLRARGGKKRSPRGEALLPKIGEVTEQADRC
eukprot:693825-Prorocentrum_minimum.AAC.1